MEAPAKLRVLPRGTARVPDFEKLEGAHLNAFIGWDCKPIGPEVVDRFIDPQLKQVVEEKKPSAVFIMRVGEVHEVTDRKEYRLALRDGSLWPADKQTADTVGVPYDPAFGGEHAEDVKSETAKAVDELTKAATSNRPKKA